MIDITTIGKYTEKVKIAKLKHPEGEAKLGFIELENYEKKPIKFWKSSAAKFGVGLEIGAEAEAEIEVKQGQYGLESFLVSFGGSKSKSFGGSRAYTPKEFYAELAPSVGGIFNHGIDKGLKPEEIRPFAKEYISIMREVRSQ